MKPYRSAVPGKTTGQQRPPLRLVRNVEDVLLPQSISGRVLDACLALVALGVVLVWLGQITGVAP